MTLAFTVLLPVLNLYLLKRFNIVKDFKMEDKSQRSLPYFVTAFFYFGITYLIWNFSISPVFRAILFASSISILLSSLINYKWKISAHMVGAGGLVATIFFVSYFLKQQNTIWICATFLFAGITGSARLLLQAHTEKEVYSGFLLGIVSVTLSLWITLYFS
jgi:hypothetical protein